MKQAIKRGWKLKSRILVLMLIMSLVVGLLPGALLPAQQAVAAAPNGFQSIELTGEFQDVKPEDWYYNAVVYVQKNGIFNGTDIGTFSPDGTMTRAMFVTALGRMEGVDVSEYSIPTFGDVQTGIWYAPYVEWAAEKGITTGTGNGNFAPDLTVSREQMVTMILRYFESYQISYQASNPITTEPKDIADISPWAVDAVVKLWQAGMFVGDAKGNFNPHTQATRAEAAVSFMRSDEVVKESQKNQAVVSPTPTPIPSPTPMPSSTPTSNSGGSGNTNYAEYAIIFESNGGTAVTGQTVKDGSKAVVPQVPTKEGYSFDGWYSDSGLTKLYAFTEAVTSNTTLHAKWTIKSLSVSFDNNGGPKIENQAVNYGSMATEPVAPKRTGYTFGGWYSDSSLTTTYQFTTPVTIDTTLYAKWIAIYNVSFNSNGGSAVLAQTVSDGDKAESPSAPTKKGYVFSGWYSDSALDKTYDFTTAVVTGNITLFAKWTVEKKNSYTVSFNSNGGTAVAGQTVEEGSVAAIPSDPTKKGHTFSGWYSDSKLATAYGFTAEVTSNVTLYAKWTINSYTVSFDSNNGSSVNSESVNYGSTVKKPEAPTRTGHTFGGWYSDSKLATAYSFTEEVTDEITLYAKWTINNYTVSFNSNGGTIVASQSVKYDGSAMKPTKPTRADHTFEGWYSDVELRSPYGFTAAVTSDITLYAKWAINSYTVTFDSKGGSTVKSHSTNHGDLVQKPEDPTRTGHAFGGWYSDSQLENAYDFTVAVTGNITLYANWLKSSYAVSFESNSGTLVESQPVNYGDLVQKPEDPTRSGHAFEGWYSDSELENAYDFTVAVTGNITLYAKWTANSYTVSFESNGGTTFATQTVQGGEVLSKLPAPFKEDFIFQGWFTDSKLTHIFVEDSPIIEDTELYAKYIDSIENAVQSIPSFAKMDVASNFKITVKDASGALTKEQVKAGMEFKDTANPDFAGIKVTGEKGLFTVSSAVEDGKFVEGNTYQLTLVNEQLSFHGQDETTRVYVFSIAKQEVMNVPLNPDMIFLAFNDVEDMLLDGKEVGSPAIPVMRTTVGGSGNALAEANAGSGTFVYEGSSSIKAGDVVAIYQGIHPNKRTIKTTDADDGDIAYVQITAVNGKTYTYGRVDAEQVLFKPDVLPVSVLADQDGLPNNNSITVDHTLMNYSDSKYEPLGLDELTTVDVGDYIGFYEGEFGEEGFKAVGYGLITSIRHEAELDIIEYIDATVEDVVNSFSIYQKEALSGDVLLSEEQSAQIEAQIERQAHDSGFVDQAASYLSTLAMETDTFKAASKVTTLSDSEVSVKNLTVVAELGTSLEHIDGRSSGISATLQVGADIVVEAGEDGVLIIHMVGTFVQEISLDLGVNSQTEWHWYTVSTFLGDVPIFPVIDDYVVTANLDAYSYTGLNITAEIALVEVDQVEAAIDNWLDAQTGGKFSQVQNIATEIKAIMAGVQDTDAEMDMEALKERYKEMLERDTEWVSLIKQELFEKSMHVALGLIEVTFEGEFVVSAQVNLTIGADFYYKMAKRYSVTLRVLSLSGTSNTVSLPGDGDYQFTFYVMGTLGLQAGIHMEVKAGLLSTEANSVGISVEPGAYMKLWGYFYYQLKNIAGEKSTHSLGALFVEIGIYLKVALDAQVGDGQFSTSLELVDEEWPLYTIGSAENVYDFAYADDTDVDDVGLLFIGGVLEREMPESFLKMNTFNLTTGESSQKVYDISNFDIQISDSNFVYDEEKQQIRVKDMRILSSAGTMVITWKGSPLSFTPAPLKRTIPLNRIKSADGDMTLQLFLGNGEPSEIVVAAFNAQLNIKNRVPVRTGYTFDGWYTSLNGGRKIELPARMPSDLSIVHASWIPNTDTPYRVDHYLIDENTRKPSLYESEIKKGTTESNVSYISNKYESIGYKEARVMGSIKADGTTVMNVYYSPISRTMTFDLGYEGTHLIKITDLVNKNMTNRIPLPIRAGYKFVGWSPEDPTIMPREDTTYTANWIARDDMPYKVVYLKQDIGHTTYTVADVETHRGTTNTKVVLAQDAIPSYEGFTLDTSIPGTVLESTISGNGGTVLKVYYKRNSYKLTVDYNDLRTPEKAVNIPYGSSISIHMGEPIREGQSFAGWSPVLLTTMPAHDLAYIAQWSKNQFTVNFNHNGGVEEVPSQTLEYGERATEPVAPTKRDHTFGGWYSDAALKTRYSFATQVTSNMTLYAKWLRSFTLSFNSNGGTEIPAQSVYEETKAEIPSSPTREGYVFGGWFSDEELTKSFNLTTDTVKKDMTLHAKWTVAQKREYEVRFYETGAALLKVQKVKEGGVAEAFIPSPKPGHTFLFWQDKDRRGVAFDFTTPVMKHYNFYTAWKINEYEVSFMSEGEKLSRQSVYYNYTVTAPSNPIREGYAFKGWYSDANLTTPFDFSRVSVKEDITLYAKWTRTFAVSFDSNGGPAISTQTVEYNSKATAPTPPVRTGYVFGGWYSNSAMTDAYNFASLVTTSFTLYAKWIPLVSVSFELNGGAPAIAQKTVKEGDEVSKPVDPAREGYVFAGWYGDEGLSTAYVFGTPVMEDISLYAKWKKIYKVIFIWSDGRVDKEVVEGNLVTPPDVPLNGTQMVYGWRDSRQEVDYDFDMPVMKDLILQPRWGYAYTIKFESNGGSEVETQIIKGGGKIKVPEPPVRPGFVFDGWYRDAEFKNLFNFESRLQAITLYAKWREL